MTSAATVTRRIASGIMTEGLARTGRRALRRAARLLVDRWSLVDQEFPLLPEDVVYQPTVARDHQKPPVTGTLRIGWVCTPPGPGSGGHTTFFRMVQAMESRGHQCTLYLYDPGTDSVGHHRQTIARHWPGLRAEVRSVSEGLDSVDAVVASSWPTAHVIVQRAPERAHRFYFIQDYEPYFYPRGVLYSLAEHTYGFGLTNIALGGMIANVMKAELGFPPEAIVPFGCDTTVYRLLDGPPARPRTGVVHYAKRGVDRRGYILAKLALERFHELAPDQEIHIYGDQVNGWSVPVTNHGSLPPQELNELYNRTIAGLAISFTNVSLVPGELLAAGNIPILNKEPFAYGLLTDQDAVWAPPSPEGLAQALADAVHAGNINERAARIAGRSRVGWSATQDAFAAVLESTCSGSDQTASGQTGGRS